jgi:hypothetical protein
MFKFFKRNRVFNFLEFYNGLKNRTDYLDGYWDCFPAHGFKFKQETFSLLNENIKAKDGVGLSHTLGVIAWDGADRDYTGMMLSLLDENWHISGEDIVSILGLIKDPDSVNKLYEVAVNVPDYDEMRAMAKKCMWALAAINTPTAIEKLFLLTELDDYIINENACFHLKYLGHL